MELTRVFLSKFKSRTFPGAVMSENNADQRMGTGVRRYAQRSLALLCASSLMLQSTAALAADVTTYTYDEDRSGAFNVGELTSASNDAATIRYDHDALGNVTSQRWEIDGQTYTQTFTYAPHGELLRRSFADGDVFPSASSTVQYDGAGLLNSVPGVITNISRNANFDPISTTYANGTTEAWRLDPNRRWLTSISVKSGSGALFDERYHRDNKGRITWVSSNRQNGNWQYGYDTADRLITATNLNKADHSQTFQYDAADNITHNSAVGDYTYPAPTAARPHAVTKAGNLTYAYDANGNMTSGAGRTISYDGEDRPVSITYGGQTTTFVYGPDGRRLKKATAGNTTLYLGADEEITPDGTHVKHPHTDIRKADNEVNWLHRDHLSSVKLMTNATGQIISENFYKPYGERTDVQVAAGLPRESKGWIGERDDPETGLTYLNARYYDPVLARFISPDWYNPMYTGVGTNRYAYATNNPILYKDPSGNSRGDQVTELDPIVIEQGESQNDRLTDLGHFDNGTYDGSTCGGNTCRRRSQQEIQVAGGPVLAGGWYIGAEVLAYFGLIYGGVQLNNEIYKHNSNNHGATSSGSVAASGSPDPDEDPKNEKIVTYGKNAPSKLRKHSQHIRETARELGIDIPTKPSSPATQIAMENFIKRVITQGTTATGRYMSIPDAKWSRLGNAIVVRRSNNEFVTFLDATKGGAARGFPGGL
ncbi:MAG: RHS repeat-associated core domain-containing protein [Pseudomonadota bacterium]